MEKETNLSYEGICEKTGEPIKYGYCGLCINDTEEREGKSGCTKKQV